MSFSWDLLDTFSQSYTGIMGFREEDHRGKSTILNTSYQRYILSTWLIIADVDLNYLAQISTRLVQAGLLSLARALSLSLRHTHTHTHTHTPWPSSAPVQPALQITFKLSPTSAWWSRQWLPGSSTMERGSVSPGSPLLLYYLSWKVVTIHILHMRGGESCPTSERVE